jgi:hypothetical protein
MQVAKIIQMGIKIQTDIDKLMAQAKVKCKEAIEEKILIAFRLAFTDAANYAKGNQRDGGNDRYTDQTGALNSSTGFQLFKHGEQVASYFGGEGGDGTGHSIGQATGQRTAGDAGSEMASRWICGVLVAGMDYAVYVEARGFDVLTAAEFKLPGLIRERLIAVFGNSGAFQINTTNEF